jgi:hypothetical protein
MAAADAEVSMTWRCKRLVFGAVSLPILAYLGWMGYVRLCSEPVQSNTLVGRKEHQIRESYGQPNKDLREYQSLALYMPPELPPGPIRTLIFHPRGLLHPEGGTLWVWVVERDGEWVCFESCWYADSVRF